MVMFLRKKILCIMCILCVLLTRNIVWADEIADDDDDEINGTVLTAAETSDLDINSRNAVAYDRATGRVIWGKNENKRTAMASTTKILTSVVVLENVQNLDEVVTVSGKAAGTGGSRLGLKKGDKVSVKNLLYGLMLRSGNDAAVALAEFVGGSVENFAKLMNNKARVLGLKDSNFVTPHGLDDAEHYTTAFELAQITDYALKNSTFAKIVGTKSCTIQINKQTKSINNTNELLGYFPGVYGVKTGFTNNAGRCLVTAVKNEKFDIITVVLQADTKKFRAQDSMKIINYIMKNYERINVQEKVEDAYKSWCEVNLNRINISKSKPCAIELEREELETKSLMMEHDEINVYITGIFDYEAPIGSGTKFGEIRVYNGNELLEVDDIVFKRAVERKGFQEYFKDCLKSITYLL